MYIYVGGSNITRRLREKQELKIRRGDFPRLAEALPAAKKTP
ncbi:hypothetical protein ACFPU1_09830 [Thalassorhabdus alkalitolerans]|uniref:Uncharacterized protein n=1 Tax=Thalassorhabdus alkalitolerans TaxID=2282697 RepID=A0ABW0YP14_9BACI|nr:hypothetical protein [Thalassobacillus sp. C254]